MTWHASNGEVGKYMPHMNSLASTIWPGVLYTCDNDDDTNTKHDADADANNSDDNVSCLQVQS